MQSSHVPQLHSHNDRRISTHPKALKRCSRDLRAINVSDTVIVASRLSGAVEHHTASSHAIRSPALFPEVHPMHEPCVVQQLSAKINSPM